MKASPVRCDAASAYSLVAGGAGRIYELSLLLFSGCGRIDFDATPDVGLDATVDATPGQLAACPASPTAIELIDERTGAATDRVTVRAPGSFSLTFDAAHAWQASDWVDERRAPGVSLANTTGNLRLSTLLLPWLPLMSGNWHDVVDAVGAGVSIAATNANGVVLATSVQWEPGGIMVTGAAEHIICASGDWFVNAGLFHDQQTTYTVDRLEAAELQLDPAIPWNKTFDVVNGGYTVEAQGGGPRFEVSGTTVPVMDVTEAELGNAHLVLESNIDILPGTSFAFGWRVTLL